ncbi:MAG: translation initiation factor IF-3 [Verrucomicrobia bacterium]|nr:translation initiation factor IF-3 [Verrucomicrobiota bacterium]MBR4250669.1 translation initiation factor IF-3 [Verrucomicrobiota bacterium]
MSNFPQRRSNNQQQNNQIRVNAKIRAREVRVISGEGKMLGVMSVQNALVLAKEHGVDLVEISPNAVPPVCKLVNIGKYLYDAAKREKEAKKKQHTNKVKEIQIRPAISDRDMQVKLDRAIVFFCNDMKVKLVLRFKGREMQHKEFGFETVNKFIEKVTPFASADSEPKIVGKGITVMLNPLPRSRRAKNPKGEVNLQQLEEAELEDQRKLDAEEGEESSQNEPQEKNDSRKGGKKSSFGAPVLDEINLEISPKAHRHDI